VNLFASIGGSRGVVRYTGWLGLGESGQHGTGNGEWES
jgi:hypothetical protein